MRMTPAKAAFYRALPEIKERAKLASEQAVGAAHIVYLIINPAVPDPLGKFAGLPIYVGMSAKIEQRVLRHFYNAAFKRVRRRSVRRPIRRLLTKGTLVQFAIMGRFQTLVDAQIAEIYQSQELIAQGYKLRNLWTIQSKPMSAQQLADLATRWQVSFAKRRTRDDI